ncbi:MAG: hypothetical protein SGPRY_006580 [Prymnesium sp.]
MKPCVQQKTPKRPPSAIRKATTAGLCGYQGESTTKAREDISTKRASKPRTPLVEQKKPQRPPRAVRQATKAGLAGYQGKSPTREIAEETRGQRGDQGLWLGLGAPP